MAPLAPNNTSRLFIDYQANALNHTLMLRYSDTELPPQSDFLESLDDFLTSCNFCMPTDWTFNSWRYSLAGSNVTVPLSGAPTAFAGQGTVELAERPSFLSFIGRSSLGRRFRAFLLGTAFSPAQEEGVAVDYRVYASENADVAAAIAALDLVNSPAIDDAQVTLKNYVNLGYHAYWQKRVRG